MQPQDDTKKKIWDVVVVALDIDVAIVVGVVAAVAIAEGRQGHRVSVPASIDSGLEDNVGGAR